MTGYANVLGKPTDGGAANGATVAIELRSVNSRFLDLAFRLPDEFRGVEGPLRELLTAGFRRGKIELRLAEQREREAASSCSWASSRPRCATGCPSPPR